MKFKNEHVNPHGIRSELLLGLTVAADIYKEHGTDMVVTSLNDGKHSRTSLHYSGSAADLRIRNIVPPATAQSIRDKIVDALNPNYDVILERDHIHLEYQPKGKS